MYEHQQELASVTGRREESGDLGVGADGGSVESREGIGDRSRAKEHEAVARPRIFLLSGTHLIFVF